MHPVNNIRGIKSRHLEGKRIVLAVCGSIAAVRTVELCRELIRHGADVVAVMSGAATRIIHPDALHFATGNKPITKLTGAVEHVALLGDVPEKADALLVAPATANTVAKMAQGIDDGPVTTCATVAFGTRTPVVVAPAMHEAMLDHAIVTAHAELLQSRFGVGWIEPQREEHKAKLADPELIAEGLIHHLARRDGPLAGKKCLVVGGATAERVDAIRILTNRSSGRSAFAVARELRRLGGDVTLWFGHGTLAVPADLADCTEHFMDHASLVKKVEGARFDIAWMPAAIADYTPDVAEGKIPSGQDALQIALRPVSKIIPLLQQASPDLALVAFKAEAHASTLEAAAKGHLEKYGALAVIGNTAEAFGGKESQLTLFTPEGAEPFEGPKDAILAAAVRRVHA